jgi:hypothetical protein
LNRNLHDLRVCNFELAHGCLSKRVTTQSYNAAIFMSLCLVPDRTGTRCNVVPTGQIEPCCHRKSGWSIPVATTGTGTGKLPGHLGVTCDARFDIHIAQVSSPGKNVETRRIKKPEFR